MRIRFKATGYLGGIFVLISCFLGPYVLRAETQSQSPVLERIEKIEARVEEMAKNQDAIIANQNAILEKIKQLRVWVRRN